MSADHLTRLLSGDNAMTEKHLTLLRETVKAKMRYWDALRELEVALTGDEFGDADNNAIIEYIDTLAAGLTLPEHADEHVTDEHLARIIKLDKLWSTP